MTQQEIYRQIIALPFREQKELIEKLSRNLKSANVENGNKEFEEQETSAEGKKAAYMRLRGALKMKNPPMTKEEVREIYYEHLVEKHK